MTTTLLETAYKAIDDKKGEDVVVLRYGRGIANRGPIHHLPCRIQDAKYKQLRKK